MSIEGRIAIDVNFADSATGEGVQSLKKISLTDTTSYTTGKVALVTGTCGTAQVTIDPASLSYKNAAGDTVSFTSVRRIALKASGPPVAYYRGFLNTIAGFSDNDLLVVSEALSGSIVAGDYRLATTAGTASYTIVFYGT